ncbi:PTS fructose transporter subunit IIABC [Corynebacterium sp. CNJ-954]|uniref:fructose-specific PTS transporter subunit EIIC n=1 Tax=Corynebacterium sp. CNJ-954 TaxID=1904962 RepID=UPI00095D4FE7|nr:fructose-specific PTS transporter subunit EIIC [Corynebacterium sp. CNJ-954]OLT51861.1 PTS fructose transporter subunit IIABC [Corynebacterium sp. CNJ-954]
MAEEFIVAATGCPTGVAHTFMAEDALKQAAAKRGIEIRVETHGQVGLENELTADEIKRATGVIIAADKEVNARRFAGKAVVDVGVKEGIHHPDQLIDRVLAKAAAGTPGSSAPGSGNDEPEDENDFLNVAAIDTSADQGWRKVGRAVYKHLMNGVSYMLPFVVGGGVLLAASFLFGIYSADPTSDEYNRFAEMLNTVGSTGLGLMVPVLSAFIAFSISSRPGLTVGLITGLLAADMGTGFLGGIVTGFLAGYGMLYLGKLFDKLPKALGGLKAIFLLPVIGTLVFGGITFVISAPMESISVGLQNFLADFQGANPVVLGIIIGCMAGFDMGGPVNKAVYVTGVALLAEGNMEFMAAVSAACIAPPIITAIAVTLFPRGFEAGERKAGYVNYLLGSTHITEGAIPFAARNPLVVIPLIMLGSSISAILTLLWGVTSPAPHGGFLVLPIVGNPFGWVLAILIGSAVSGVLYGLYRLNQSRKTATAAEDTEAAEVTEVTAAAPEPQASVSPGAPTATLVEMFTRDNVLVDVPADSQEDALARIAAMATDRGYAADAEGVLAGLQAREAQMTTALMDGIAIPHAKHPAITEAALLVVRFSEPVAWPTDKALVSVAVTMLVPEAQAGTTHLKLLAKVSRALMDEDLRATLTSGTADEIYTPLSAKLG